MSWVVLALACSGDAPAPGPGAPVIDPTADTYEVISRCAPFGEDNQNQLFSIPALVGSRLYLRGEGSLVCLELEAG